MTANTEKKKWSTTKQKLWLDLALILFVALVSAPQATGIALHEWLSLIIIVPVLFHLLFNWKWIVTVTRRVFKKTPGQTRFNLFLNWLLFFDMVLVSFSGIVISEAVLPQLGISIPINSYWAGLHDLTGNLFMVLMGIHLAMHWRWIVNAFNRYILRKPARRAETAAAGGH